MSSLLVCPSGRLVAVCSLALVVLALPREAPAVTADIPPSKQMPAFNPFRYAPGDFAGIGRQYYATPWASGIIRVIDPVDNGVVAQIKLANGQAYPSVLAAGDIDGDGRDELAYGVNGKKGQPRVVVLDDARARFAQLCLCFSDWGSGRRPSSLAFGSPDGKPTEFLAVGRSDAYVFVVGQSPALQGIGPVYDGQPTGDLTQVTTLAWGAAGGAAAPGRPLLVGADQGDFARSLLFELRLSADYKLTVTARNDRTAFPMDTAAFALGVPPASTPPTVMLGLGPDNSLALVDPALSRQTRTDKGYTGSSRFLLTGFDTIGALRYVTIAGKLSLVRVMLDAYRNTDGVFVHDAANLSSVTWSGTQAGFEAAWRQWFGPPTRGSRPPAPPAEPWARVTIAGRATLRAHPRAGRRAAVPVTLRCRAYRAARCNGRLKLVAADRGQRLRGRSSFRLARRATRVLRVPLPARASRALRRSRTVRVRARVGVDQPRDDVRVTHRRTLTILAPQRRGRARMQ
jgi:FG-GAP repeat